MQFALICSDRRVHPNNYGGICLLDVNGKRFTKILKKQLMGRNREQITGSTRMSQKRTFDHR